MKSHRRNRKQQNASRPKPKLHLEHLELREMMAADALTAAPLANVTPASATTQSVTVDWGDGTAPDHLAVRAFDGSAWRVFA